MDPVLVVLIAIVVWLLVLSAGMALSLWLLGRRNRIRVDRPTIAPLTWLWSPARGARLHRRLRAAAGWVDADPSGAHDHLRTMLVDQAVELDRYVVQAGRSPRSHRRTMLTDASRRVGEVERLSVRVHALTDPGVGQRFTRYGPAPEVADNLDRLKEHLDLLEQANAELADLESPPVFDQRFDASAAPVPEPSRADPRIAEAPGRQDRPQPRSRPQPG